MTQARASHLRLVVNEPTPVTVRQPRLRFQPVVRLADGAAFGMHAEADIAFEDTFQPRHLSDAAHPSAAGWLGDLIEVRRLSVTAEDSTVRVVVNYVVRRTNEEETRQFAAARA